MTRVVTAVAADGVRLRGRLTLHFASPRPSEQAEHAGDLAALTTSELFADTFDHKNLLGEEAAIAGRVRNRLPDTFPPLRSLELVALHVVAQGGGERRPSVGRLQVVAPVARDKGAREGRFSLQVPRGRRRDSAPSLSLPETPDKPERPGAVTRKGLGPPEALDAGIDCSPATPTRTAVGKVDLRPAAGRIAGDAKPPSDCKPEPSAKGAPAGAGAAEPEAEAPRPAALELAPPQPEPPVAPAPARRRSSVKIPRAASRPRIPAPEPSPRGSGRGGTVGSDAASSREAPGAPARPAAAPRRRSEPKRPSIRPDPRRDDDSSPPLHDDIARSDARRSEPPQAERERNREAQRPRPRIAEGGTREARQAATHRDFSAPKPKGLLSRALDEVQPGDDAAGLSLGQAPAERAAGGSPHRGATDRAKPVAAGKRPRAPRWRRRLEALGDRATLETVGPPVASLLRDVAARLLLAVLLAQDPDSFDVVLVLHRPDDPADNPEDVALARMGLEQLARETGAAAAHVLYASLLASGVPHNIAIDTLQELCGGSLPCGKLPVAELGRYLGTHDLVSELSRAVADALGVSQSDALRAAVSPLLDVARDELRIAADYLRRASGL